LALKTHLDLFSGIGGFALACRWHGIETIGLVEWDEYCQQALARNFPGVPQFGDITELDPDIVRGWLGPRPLDLLTAGYPCQPFSAAGKRKGKADDRYLWPEVARLMRELRPRYALLENVFGHVRNGLDDVLDELEDIGYAARPGIVPACAVNAPHERKRLWIICADREQGD
jgi:DNA (cytosine-5)-methyltransferase 1